jgi:phosphoglycerol transferase MdoB-like AlkP superfamily enzyme
MVLTLGVLRKIEPFAHIARSDVMYDLGNLMMALTMLWAYMSFSQLLIMWSGNTQEDAAFYWHRGIAAINATGGMYKTADNRIPYEPGGWQWVSLFILVVNFFLPFLLLLTRMNKRNVSTLMKIAALILVVRVVDIFWHVIPMFSQQTFHHEQHQPTPLSLASIAMVVVAVVGIGGVWLFFYIGAIKKRPLVPVHDPRLLEVAHSHGH